LQRVDQRAAALFANGEALVGETAPDIVLDPVLWAARTDIRQRT